MRFEFGPTPALGSSIPASTSEGEATTQTASAALEGLAPASTYYYRLTATTSDGTAYGATRSFTTAAYPPAPATLPRTLVPYLTLAQVEAKEPPVHQQTIPLTNAQKLKQALKACHKKRGHKRKACDRQRHGPKKKR